MCVIRNHTCMFVMRWDSWHVYKWSINVVNIFKYIQVFSFEIFVEPSSKVLCTKVTSTKYQEAKYNVPSSKVAKYQVPSSKKQSTKYQEAKYQVVK